MKIRLRKSFPIFVSLSFVIGSAGAETDENLALFSDLAAVVTEHELGHEAVPNPLLEIVNLYYQGNKTRKRNSGDFIIPVEGHLTSCYGYRKKFKRFHKGIDVALHKGDTVRCALPGTVRKTGYEKKGYGRYVVVSHGGDVETLYGHLMVCMVNPGQKVEAGEALGLGGTTGNATGPHLHFETRYRGVAYDPVSWFNISLP